MLGILCIVAIGVASTESSRYMTVPEDVGTEFSIRVAQHITAEAGLCVEIPCVFTYPGIEVPENHRRVWFKGEPLKPTFTTHVERGLSFVNTYERECSFFLNDVIEGESDGEYGFQVNWGRNQLHVFEDRVQVTVTALSQKPTVYIPPLTEGKPVTLTCDAPGFCSGTAPKITWYGIGIAEYVGLQTEGRMSNGRSTHSSEFEYYPKSKDHNTNLTCKVVYTGDITTEQSMILTVKYRPKIVNGSRCVLQGKVLTCVCISHGVPSPVIDWPRLTVSSTFYTITPGSIQTVKSTITMSATNHTNTSIECVSSNEIGQSKMKLQTVTEAVVNAGATPTDISKKSKDAALPWVITGLSITLNVCLILCLTIFTARKKDKMKEPKEEVRIYTSLAKTDEPETDEPAYETINQTAAS